MNPLPFLATAWHGLQPAPGMMIAYDGSAEAEKRIARVLWNNPGMGVMRGMRLLPSVRESRG